MKQAKGTNMKPAKGTKGFILYSPIDKTYFFRIYDPVDKSKFEDYDLLVEDIEVEILSSGLVFIEPTDNKAGRLDYRSLGL